MNKSGTSIPSSKSALQLSSTQRPIQNIGPTNTSSKNDRATEEVPPVLSVEADAEMASEILSPRPPPDDIAPDELALFVATGGNTGHSSKRSSIAVNHLTHSLACQSDNALSPRPKSGADAPKLWKRMFCCVSPQSEYRHGASGRSRYICSCFILSHEENKAAYKLDKEGEQPPSTVAAETVDCSQPCITSPMPGNTGKETQSGALVPTKEPSNGATTNAPLLPPVLPKDENKKCFVIDLDETLVHSSFTLVNKADFKVGVDIEGRVHQVYVLKRPYVDMFLDKLGPLYECVLFTASLSKYADPVTNFIDPKGHFRHRLFRDSCCFYNGNYVKDLSMLGRDVNQTVILDNSPVSYLFHNANAVHILSWFDNPTDRALIDLIPYFEQLARAPNVPDFLATNAPPVSATGSSPLNRPASLASNMRNISPGTQPRQLNYINMLRNAPQVANALAPYGASSTTMDSSITTSYSTSSASTIDRRPLNSTQHLDSNIITQVKKPH